MGYAKRDEKASRKEAPVGPGSRIAIAALPIAFFAGHACSLLIGGGQAQVLSFGWLVAAPLLAGLVCIRRSIREGLEGWLPLGFAMLIWASGMASSTIARMIFEIDSEDRLSMLLYVLYGVPLIFALVSPEADRWTMRLVDAVLAVVLGYMFFVYVHHFATASGTRPEDLGALKLMFDIENIYIALFAVVRLVSCRPKRTEFFRTVTIFAALYGVAAAYINHMDSDSEFGNWSDLVVAVPFLALAWLVLREPSPLPERTVMRRPALARVVRAGSPMLIPVSLLTVSVLLVSFNPVMAVAGCIVASLGYGLRTVLVQVQSFAEHDELAQLSNVDALTGIANRRRFDDVLHREWNRRARGSGQLVLLMIDIDNFKPFNDQFGHFAGDQVLRAVAIALQSCARRDSDLVARYGGEEFAAILPDADVAGAGAIADRMRAAVEAMPLPASFGERHVTVSIGLACAEETGSDIYAFTGAADGALYDAKRGGRNQVVHHCPGEVVSLHPGRTTRDGRAA
jgi:diguanylate cyclase (GGDEF)-like protein